MRHWNRIEEEYYKELEDEFQAIIKVEKLIDSNDTKTILLNKAREILDEQTKLLDLLSE